MHTLCTTLSPLWGGKGFGKRETSLRSKAENLMIKETQLHHWSLKKDGQLAILYVCLFCLLHIKGLNPDDCIPR